MPSMKSFRRFRLAGHAVRAMIDETGTPWVVAADLAEPLGMPQNTIVKALATYPTTEKQQRTGEDAEKIRHLARRKVRAGTMKKTHGAPRSKRRDLGGASTFTIIAEPAVYRLIARCQDALKEGTFAFRFMQWVYSEVLPSLRKRGGYLMTKQARAIVQGVPGWQDARDSGKEARRELTDTVREFVAYATARGSINAQFYYGNFTKLAWRLARLGDVRDRDMLSIRDLIKLELVEEYLAEWIANGMADGLPYKDVFVECRLTGERVLLRREPRRLRAVATQDEADAPF